MRLCEGRIGNQEGTSAAGLAAGMSVIFTLDSQRAYAFGNATYITSPAALIIAAGIFLLMCAALERSGASRLDELLKKALGGVGRYALGIVAAAMLIFSAWSLLERFATVMHSFVFVTSDYAPIIVWAIAGVAFMALMGFECIARMAKILALTLGLLLLLGFFGASGGYDAYRLAPFPADSIISVVKTCAESVTAGFAPLLGLLCVAPALQNGKSLRRSGLIGAGTAALIAGLAQLCIGLAYPHEKLSEMLMPLYRLNTILIRESYWFRLDKLSIFIWLTGCVTAAAYYVYCASSLVTRLWTRYDVRPAAASISAALAAFLLLGHLIDGVAYNEAVDFVERFAWLAVPLFGVAACISLIRTSAGKRRRDETA